MNRSCSNETTSESPIRRHFFKPLPNITCLETSSCLGKICGSIVACRWPLTHVILPETPRCRQACCQRLILPEPLSVLLPLQRIISPSGKYSEMRSTRQYSCSRCSGNFTRALLMISSGSTPTWPLMPLIRAHRS
jgi:hypothetical protein